MANLANACELAITEYESAETVLSTREPLIQRSLMQPCLRRPIDAIRVGILLREQIRDNEIRRNARTLAENRSNSAVKRQFQPATADAAALAIEGWQVASRP